MTKDNEIALKIFDYGARDVRFWHHLERLSESHELNTKYIEDNFSAILRRRKLPRSLRHYKQCKHIIDLLSSVIELGVSAGVSLIAWTHLILHRNGLNKPKKYGLRVIALYAGADDPELFARDLRLPALTSFSKSLMPSL